MWTVATSIGAPDPKRTFEAIACELALKWFQRSNVM
jgi:hypothetical protein